MTRIAPTAFDPCPRNRIWPGDQHRAARRQRRRAAVPGRPVGIRRTASPASRLPAGEPRRRSLNHRVVHCHPSADVVVGRLGQRLDADRGHIRRVPGRLLGAVQPAVAGHVHYGGNPATRRVVFTAPSTMAPGQASTVQVQLTASGDETVPDAQLALQLPAGWTAVPVGPTDLTSVAPGTAPTATFQVTPPSYCPMLTPSCTRLRSWAT